MAGCGCLRFWGLVCNKTLFCVQGVYALPGHVNLQLLCGVAVAFGEGGLGGKTTVSLQICGGTLKSSFSFGSQTHTGVPEAVFQGVEQVWAALFHRESVQATGVPKAAATVPFPLRWTLPQAGAGEPPPPPRTLIFLFSVWSCFHLQGKGELLEDFQSSLWHSGRQLGGAGQTWGAPVSASIHTWRAGVK